MTRETILAEIRRIADASGGEAPGVKKFESLTGITQALWRGKFWLRWSDAVTEAGFSPRAMVKAHSDEFLLKCLAGLTRELEHFPTSSELRMKGHSGAGFPNFKVFDRLGRKAEKVQKLNAFVERSAEYSDIVSLLSDEGGSGAPESQSVPVRSELGDGHVYMLRLGKHYKIGRTTAVPRRHREIALELPMKPDIVHHIRTDDPEGIEKYWHTRFAAKRTNGEWFALDAQDIRAFKRRRFM